MSNDASDRAATMMPGRNGGQLRRGAVPGTSPRGKGPAAHWLKAACEKRLKDPQTWARIDGILQGGEPQEVLGVLKWLADRAFGRARESVEVMGNIGAVVEHRPLAILLPPLEVVAAPATAVTVAAEAPDGFALPALGRVPSTGPDLASLNGDCAGDDSESCG